MLGGERVMEGRADELLLGLKEAPKWVLEKVASWRRGDGGEAASWRVEWRREGAEQVWMIT